MAGPAYFDTSALVKRYVQEPGSAQTRALLRRHRLLSSAIAPLEILSALSRRRTAGDLTPGDFSALMARIRGDRSHWELLEVSTLVLDRAEELTRAVVLRTLDAIHVASAMTFRSASGLPMPFVTADARQREAASRVTLDVVWIG